MSVDFICIGASLGGVKALNSLFSYLPYDFAVPIAVVLHRSPDGIDHLIGALQNNVKLVVQEATDKEKIRDSTITVAPADYHLMVDGEIYALSVDPPVQFARPSIDVLFESVALQYGTTGLGILLTGGGNDGIVGLQCIKDRYGAVMVQSPESAEDSTLPQSAVDRGIVPMGYSIEKIATNLLEMRNPDYRSS